MPDQRDDVAAVTGAPPHGLAAVLTWVAAEVMSRAHRPRQHQLAHDRVLHVVRDHHERPHPVTSFTGEDARGPAERAAEVSERSPEVPAAYETQPHLAAETGGLRIRLDRLQGQFQGLEEPGFRVETRLES